MLREIPYDPFCPPLPAVVGTRSPVELPIILLDFSTSGEEVLELFPVGPDQAEGPVVPGHFELGVEPHHARLAVESARLGRVGVGDVYWEEHS